MVGPYTITNKQTKKTLTLWAVTMIDPATGWFEMKTVNEKDAMTVANVVEQVWLTRYPWPEIVTYDKGREFMDDFAKMVIKISGKDLSIQHIDGPLGVRGRNSDNRLIYQKLGWKPTESLRIGIERLYKWIEEQIK